MSILVLVLLMASCSEQKSPSDLSFSGIKIGQPFPDSLKNNGLFTFEYGDIPYYTGKINFKFPTCPDKDLNVAAEVNEDGKVVSIQITNLTLDEASDFYNMLKSKYGFPTSDYGDTDCRLQDLLKEMYKQLGYVPYTSKTNISGKRIIAEWKSPICRSDILMLAETFHLPNEFEPKLNTCVWFMYVDTEERAKAIDEANLYKLNKSREVYRKQNQNLMNQDF